jgi:hypothetical protein
MSVALNHLSTLVGHVALNPVVSASLLWILTKGPDGLRDRLIANITVLRDPKRLAQVVKALTWCLAFGVTGVVNRRLNDVALNAGRWRSDKNKWNWGEEIAIITGGCSGIGELIVKRLVGRGIRVAVLDILDLPKSLQGCKCHCDWGTEYQKANRLNQMLISNISSAMSQIQKPYMPQQRRSRPPWVHRVSSSITRVYLHLTPY